MNEIEELQESMASSQQAVPAASVTEPALAEHNAMEEFQAGGSDVSMEETLANLKDDEPSGPNLIDQAIEAESELLDDAEVAELDDAIEAAEAQAVAETEFESIESIQSSDDEILEVLEEVQEEPVRMSQNTRRPRPEPVSSPVSGGGSVSVNLSGNMTLNLTYEFEGQDVTIGFTDGALHVSLGDGTEFKIPVRRNPLRKTA